MNSRKILIVDDDVTLLDIIKYNLNRDDYEVICAADGSQALENARNEKPDLIILDLMLPKLSGLEVCRILRKEMTVPILMLTARNEEIDKVVGLEIGGDDYMTKPFSMRELMARVRAMLRRAEMSNVDSTTSDNIIIHDLEINFARRRATLAASVLDMTSKEFDLLAFLAKNR
ncbi:MAG: response regulator transcription factor, partial [Dehalococcoidales bacterium]